MSVSPTLDPIANVTVGAGAPLHIALNATDPDGDTLTFSAESDNANLSTFIPEGNRSLQMTVEDFGQMTFELFEGRSPIATGRIIELAESGFYNGTIFHRIIDGFMIQGGDPEGTGRGGSGEIFDNEPNVDLLHTSPGLLSMANAGPDTNDSQFFITDTATRLLDYVHPVFGLLTEGDSVREAISSVPTNDEGLVPGLGQDQPLEDVVLSSVEVITDMQNGVLMLSVPAGITSGQANVTVTVDDGNEGTHTQTFLVTITGDITWPQDQNSDPYLERVDDVSLLPGGSITIPLIAYDAQGDELTFDRQFQGEVELTAEIEGNELTLSAPEDAYGKITMAVVVFDSRGGEPHVREFQVDVFDPDNNAPSIAAIDDVTLLSGSPLLIPLSGFDPDDNKMTFSASTELEEMEAFVPPGNRSVSMDVEDFGTMEFELFEGWAPHTTARFIELVESGFYDGLTFHRIIEDFMIQGGDPNGDGTGGSGEEFDDEFFFALQHNNSGILSMANSGRDTNDSQFFITSGEARWLDFKHTIFGLLTAGDNVRKALNAVDADDDDRPTESVVVNSFEIITDTDNGVLILSAPENFTGEADVTVTVDDGRGKTGEFTFHVTIEPDPVNSVPFLAPMADIHTLIDTPTQFQIPGIDIEGNEGIYYWHMPQFDDDDVTIEMSDTGLVTVTPTNGAYGVYGEMVAIKSSNAATPQWDTQFVPIFIDPPTPTGVELLPVSDTGLSDSDLLTRLNNTEDNTLQFRVTGTSSGAEVSLLADGVVIGQATSTGGAVVITTDGLTELTDGAHAITARQSYGSQRLDLGNRHETVDLSSGDSPGLEVTIKAQPPLFISEIVYKAYEDEAYSYNVDTDGEESGGIVYTLLTGPGGMTLDSATGQVDWLPQPEQGPIEDVVIQAADPAGNKTLQEYAISVLVGRAIDYFEKLDENVVGEGRSAFITKRDGRLTVEALFSHANGNIDLELRTLEGVVVANAATQTDNERIDILVSEGEVYRLYYLGTNPSVDFRFANLLVDEDDRLVVFGSEYDDSYRVQAGTPHQVTVNGIVYNDIYASTIMIDGGEGDDVAEVIGASGRDTAILRVHSGQLYGEDGEAYTIDVANVTSITLNGGGGGGNAKLYDSPGDDILVLAPHYGQMSGEDYVSRAIYFDRIDGYATASDRTPTIPESSSDPVSNFEPSRNEDVAKLYDSLGDDTLVASSTEAALFGENYYIRAKSFEQTHTYASGGYDVAEFQDSQFSDMFYGSYAEAAMFLQGPGGGPSGFGKTYYNRAKSFDQVNAYSTATTSDMPGTFATPDFARLDDSPGADTFVAERGYAEMNMPESTITLSGFYRVEAYAVFGGDDSATLHDLPDDNEPDTPPGTGPGTPPGTGPGTPPGTNPSGGTILAATSLGGTLTQRGTIDGYSIGTKFFEQTQVELNPDGSTEIRLYDSPYDDLLVLDPDEHYGEFSAGEYSLESGEYSLEYSFKFGPYSTVQAYASPGNGEDTAELHDSSGDDTFYAESIEGVLFGDEFYFRAKGFENVVAIADSGGQDIARFYDSPAGDTFTASSTYGEMSGNPDTGPYHNRAESFPDVRAYSRENLDNATLLGSPGDDLYLASSGFGQMTGDGYFTQAENFGWTTGSGELGGTDHAKMWDSPDDDTLSISGESGEYVMMTGNSMVIVADVFDRVDVYASRAGEDKADLTGTSMNETFYGSPHESALFREGFYIRVVDFEQVRSSGGGGDDEALLVDSPGDDLLTAADDWAELVDVVLADPDAEPGAELPSPDYLLWVDGFDRVTARCSEGDDSKDVAEDLLFELIPEGPWQG